MNTIYYTKTVSIRNKKVGYFEKEDFGEIKILSLTDKEASLFITLTEDKKKQQIRRFKNYYLTDNISLPFSREEDFKWIKKQGYFSPKTARALGIRLREQNKSYYPAPSHEYFLIGRHLYYPLCKISELSITICGNTYFGNWWSLEVEAYHSGKGNIKFTPNAWKLRLAEEKERIKKLNKNRKQKIYFFYSKVKVIV